MKQIKVGIVGGTGYTGVELLRLLASHPAADLRVITSRQEAGSRVDEMFPSLRGFVDLVFDEPDPEKLAQCDVVFFATPHGVAMSQARSLVDAGVRVIDLAADFRLKDLVTFKHWYKIDHACPDLLEEAVYGLPEMNRDEICRARVIGLPGCYPTAVQLGLMPVLESASGDLVDKTSLIADCKSGVSGAGRKASVSNLFAEAGDNFKAYAVGGHRHWPEIVQGLQSVSSGPVKLTFVPHLLPLVRGILATIYVRLKPEALDYDFQSLYETRYQHEPFVDVMPAGSSPETRSVRASNMVRLAIHRPPESDLLMILAVEDNLTKGASGQAVQVMNLLFDLPETTGLMQVPVLP
ncbi:MAG: N-acetyl-gamma-glutamyl-phosphate reductase [Burkholderiaceae bacterium]